MKRPNRKNKKAEKISSILLDAGALQGGAAIQRASLWRSGLRRFMRNRGAVISAVAMIVLVTYAIIVPALYNTKELYAIAYHVDFTKAYLSPSLDHPFGTDNYGRDMFIRTALGARVSLLIGFAATFVILIVGVAYGAVSGFIGGKIDNVMMRFLDALYGLPYLPFAIITLQVFGVVSITTMVAALSIVSWFTSARIVRGQIITLKENDYIRAAKAVGVKWQRVLTRHLLPNTTGLIVIVIFLELPGVILGEAFLSFIGLGINPPKSSLGSMAQEGLQLYQAHPMMIVIPSIAIAVIVMSANFIADGLRDALDPHTREV